MIPPFCNLTAISLVYLISIQLAKIHKKFELLILPSDNLRTEIKLMYKEIVIYNSSCLHSQRVNNNERNFRAR